MSEPSRVCPSCGAEHLAHTETCPRCRVALVDAAPSAGTSSMSAGRTVDLTTGGGSHRRSAEHGAQALRTVGSVMRIVGVVGVVVAVIQTYGNLSQLGDDEFLSGVEKLAIVLGAYTTLLFSVLVFGVGTLGRLAADWALLRLAPESHPADSLI